MSSRSLYIAVYDVSKPSRLRKVHQIVKAYATGGQKSAYECFLSPAERKTLFADVCGVIHEVEDRFAILRVEERAESVLRGIAIPPADPDFYYFG